MSQMYPPTHHDASAPQTSRQPGYCLPQAYYTDESVFARDVERVFATQWLFAGHAADVPQPGDYFTWQLGHDPILIIRGRDGQVRALHNVCRHRGSLICTAPQGHALSLVCPYHQWVYDCDGRLKAARLMQADFDRTQFGLKPIHTRVVEGLVFICLADTPPPIDPVIEGLTSHLVFHGCATEVKPAVTHTYRVGANWKLVNENFRECYHCESGHPEFCRVNIGESTAKRPAPGDSVPERVERWRQRWQQEGVPTGERYFSPDAPAFHYARYPFRRDEMVSFTLDGMMKSPLIGQPAAGNSAAVGIFYIVMYPNFWFHATCDQIATTRLTPVSATESLVELKWYVRHDAKEGVDYDPVQIAALWRTTVEQDLQMVEDNQRGVQSRAYSPGPYAPDEASCEQFINWYLSLAEPGYHSP